MSLRSSGLRLLTCRLFGPFFGCDRLCRLGRANHQKCSRQAWQPPSPIDLRRVSIDRAFINDLVIAVARWLVTFDERNHAAGSMARNRSFVDAQRATGRHAGFGHVPSERATGLDERRQKRDHSNLRLNKGAVPDTGQIVGHCGLGQCAAPHNTRLLSFTFSASRYTLLPISLNLALIAAMPSSMVPDTDIPTLAGSFSVAA